MPRFSANLSFLFSEKPFMERFEAASKAGFEFVEYMSPYEFPPEEIARELASHRVSQVLFNLPSGDWEKGDRGIACDPSRVEEFREGVERALEYSNVLGVERINCLAGKRLEGVSEEEQWRTLVENLKLAASRLSRSGKTLLVEPINSFDIPGFFLNRSSQALRLIQEVGAPNLKLQYDVYHMQRMEGELTSTIQKNLGIIGHIQIADNPGRHQPGTGEINYPFLLRELDRLGYKGFVGLEYIPVPHTIGSLKWIEEMGFRISERSV
ncbi:MAG: hydroxypyruvate isomerase [Thermodesulfobacteriota bacterium]